MGEMTITLPDAHVTAPCPAPLIAFDSAMKLGYDNAFDALSDAAETTRRYEARLALEDFIASDDGLRAIVDDPQFEIKVANAARLRDRELSRATVDHDGSIRYAQQRYEEAIAQANDRTARRQRQAWEMFESAQRAAIGFHGRQALAKVTA